MTKKKKKKLTPQSIRAKHKREAQKEAGVFDGRYKPRVMRDKSKYNRKDKNKGRNDKEEL